MKSRAKNPKKVKSSQPQCIKNNSLSDISEINPKAAGIDIGSREIVVAVPLDNNRYQIWSFGTFTKDLRDIVNLLKKFHVNCVAMESTGNYWIPIYEMIQENNMRPVLVNPKNTKNISGKKTDVLDAEWLATLLKYGLAAGAFRPTDTLALRTYIRQRSMLIEHRSPHILHMDKALIEMNLRLSNVVSDIVGLTGLSIIKAITSGERDPKKLASLRHERCQNSKEIIEMSLDGHYKEEQVFSLKQALQTYEFYQRQIEECEKKIEQTIRELDDAPPPLFSESKPQNGPQSDVLKSTETIAKDKKKKRNNSKNAFAFDSNSLILSKVGADVLKIGGLSEQNIWLIISEVGTNLSPWCSEKKFTSWLGLCPNNMVSGGKVLKSRTKRSKQRARQAFMLAAYSLHSSKSALGAYYRRMRARHGPEKAIVATAHKLARHFYAMLKYGTEYVDMGQDYYEKQYRKRVLKNLEKRAEELGFTLVPSEKVA